MIQNIERRKDYAKKLELLIPLLCNSLPGRQNVPISSLVQTLIIDGRCASESTACSADFVHVLMAGGILQKLFQTLFLSLRSVQIHRIGIAEMALTFPTEEFCYWLCKHSQSLESLVFSDSEVTSISCALSPILSSAASIPTLKSLHVDIPRLHNLPLNRRRSLIEFVTRQSGDPKKVEYLLQPWDKVVSKADEIGLGDGTSTLCRLRCLMVWVGRGSYPLKPMFSDSRHCFDLSNLTSLEIGGVQSITHSVEDTLMLLRNCSSTLMHLKLDVTFYQGGLESLFRPGMFPRIGRLVDLEFYHRNVVAPYFQLFIFQNLQPGFDAEFFPSLERFAISSRGWFQYVRKPNSITDTLTPDPDCFLAELVRKHRRLTEINIVTGQDVGLVAEELYRYFPETKDSGILKITSPLD
ncbi:hypothetical protein VKT23_013468 [Stygiomarasmius scandens]|uniref:Uncharacterized protein n=1 Tax=Marasmiellus scandens TaxID=2682957 RepID=A0ABR1J862_9AGAR